MSAKSIFISYNSHDATLAQFLSEAFSEQGITNWFAPNMIGVGEHYARKITPAIEECQIFLLLASKYSVGSKQDNLNGSGEVLNELQLASNNKRIILPFKLDEALEYGPEAGFAYLLAKSQWLDVSNKQLQAQTDFIVDTVKDVLQNGLQKSSYYGANISDKNQMDNIKNAEKALKKADVAVAERLLKENSFSSVYDDDILFLNVIIFMIKNNMKNLSSKSVKNLMSQLDVLMDTKYQHQALYMKAILSVLYFNINGIYDVTGGFQSLFNLATGLNKVPAKHILMFRNIKNTNEIEIKWKHFKV